MGSAVISGSMEAGAGISAAAADPLRYDGQSADPHESTGLIIAVIAPGSRVLDVGCGTGSVSGWVRDRCSAEVIGIEPSPERAKVAAGRGLTVFNTLFPSPELPPDQSFDVVLFADVLEHLVDPSAALQAARSYLRPGGCVVASIPNVAHWTVRWDLLRGKFAYQASGIMDATHLRWFTRESVHRLFTVAGYTVETYAVSAGAALPDYNWRRPWRWFGFHSRSRVIVRLARWFPRLFGCQHVLRARLIDPQN